MDELRAESPTSKVSSAARTESPNVINRKPAIPTAGGKSAISSASSKPIPPYVVNQRNSSPAIPTHRRINSSGSLGSGISKTNSRSDGRSDKNDNRKCDASQSTSTHHYVHIKPEVPKQRPHRRASSGSVAEIVDKFEKRNSKNLEETVEKEAPATKERGSINPTSLDRLKSDSKEDEKPKASEVLSPATKVEKVEKTAASSTIQKAVEPVEIVEQKAETSFPSDETVNRTLVVERKERNAPEINSVRENLSLQHSSAAPVEHNRVSALAREDLSKEKQTSQKHGSDIAYLISSGYSLEEAINMFSRRMTKDDSARPSDAVQVSTNSNELFDGIAYHTLFKTAHPARTTKREKSD